MVIRQLDYQIQIMAASYMLTMLLCMASLCYIVLASGRSALRASFAITQAVTMIWLVFAILERVSFSQAEILFNIRISLICLNFTAPLWLITILLYTESITQKNRWLIAAILAAPLTLVMPLMFPVHTDIFGLYIKDIYFDERPRVLHQAWGPFESATHLIALCCILACSYILTRHFSKGRKIRLTERIIALLVIWSPIAANYAGLRLGAPFDLTPLAFTLWGTFTIYLSNRRQFLNAMPALVWNVFNETGESMAVLGADGAVNVNRAFTEAFGPHDGDFGRFADANFPGLGGLIDQKRDFDGFESENNGASYEISMKTVYGKRRKSLGRLVTIKDVSAIKQLAEAAERTRIATGLHDSLGNRLIASINYLQIALSQHSAESAKPFIESAATCSISSLMTLRKIVEGLTPVDFGKSRLSSLLESVANRIAAAGVDAAVHISGDPEALPAKLKEFIYNTCQEALTNSIIHGKAKNISVKLSIAGDAIEMNITDDGRGCDNISPNNGLAAMCNNAKTFGGAANFESPESGGFGVHIKIPVKGGVIKIAADGGC